jgi:hypothetical protein
MPCWLAHKKHWIKNTHWLLRGSDFLHIISTVSELTSIPSKDLAGPCKERTIVKARVLVCYGSVTELGMSTTQLGKKLGVVVSMVSGAVKKGRQMVKREGLKLLDFLNSKYEGRPSTPAYALSSTLFNIARAKY